MSDDKPQFYFYTPASDEEYATMEECVKAHGSGMLVAHHTLLDAYHDAVFERDKLRARVERLREALEQVTNSRKAGINPTATRRIAREALEEDTP